MKHIYLAAVLFASAAGAKTFTLEQVLSAPFPSELIAAPGGGKVAWLLNERGARNIWIAAAPDYKGVRLTSYNSDDGQDIGQLHWTSDARAVVYVRGGDLEFLGRPDPNPSADPAGVEQAIWIAAPGDRPRKIGEGHSPALSAKLDRVAYLKGGQIWWAPLSGSDNPALLFHPRSGVTAHELEWSPDGSKLAFVSDRVNHSFIAVYDFNSKALSYLDPSVDRDSNPVWSMDGKQVAFIRQPSSMRTIFFGPRRTAEPWSIRLAAVDSGNGRELWHAAEGPGSAFHAMVAENQLFWGAGDRIVFPWEKTGFMHLYSVSIHGDTPTPLNVNGEFETEHVSLSSDGKTVLFSSNQNDIDRRHLWRVSVLGEGLTPVTRGEGIEWSPVETSDGKAVAMLHSDPRNPARAAIKVDGRDVRDLAPESIPAEFPASSLVIPQQVILSAADGMRIHGQLFLPPDLAPGEKRPAMVFFHGGSRRQMLLGWHYMDYYHNAYGMNQYLASLGYIVLAVNYRSGIGYGLDFREAINYGAAGASEFNDVLGAGLYLRSRPDVDPKRIGLWGGSYGGYLTALGLSRSSDLFAAGVDFHGVHDWSTLRSAITPSDSEREQNIRTAFESSPMASVSTWRSPVLLIHGDDDRNVNFQQTVMLVEALRKQHVEFEELIFPDEIHGFLTTKRWIQAYQASADFLGKHLK
jgi:dipeptidyl aminopeptidase/acylaminoacyl peptidase